MSTNLEILMPITMLSSLVILRSFETMANDIIWHQPGNHSTSGAKIGKEVLGAHLATFAEKQMELSK